MSNIFDIYFKGSAVIAAQSQIRLRRIPQSLLEACYRFSLSGGGIER